MAEQEQARAVAAGATVRPVSDAEAPGGKQGMNPRRKRFIKCCGCIAAVVLIAVAVILVLFFTLLRIRDPIIKMNNVVITQLDLVNGTNIPRPGVNMSMIVDVSVRNPNLSSFRHGNTTTSIYYGQRVVGEARGPPGKIKARGTERMNVTTDLITDRLVSTPGLAQDVASGSLKMGSYSRVRGKVKILNLIKRSVTVKMNCTMTVDLQSRGIRDQKCKRKVEF